MLAQDDTGQNLCSQTRFLSGYRSQLKDRLASRQSARRGETFDRLQHIEDFSCLWFGVRQSRAIEKLRPLFLDRHRIGNLTPSTRNLATVENLAILKS
jgi:hypothetical protein